MRLRRVAGHLLSLPPTPMTTAAGSAPSSASASSEIDAPCWGVISEAVAANDCDKMASVYHADAVLVNTTGSIAVTAQLVTWGEGMEKIAADFQKANPTIKVTLRAPEVGYEEILQRNLRDVVTNSLSVDYLTQPLEVFAEMNRVLKPGGLACMAFTNRCFPTKVTHT